MCSLFLSCFLSIDHNRLYRYPDWLVGATYPSEKYEFVSWDYEITNIWKVIKFHGSSHHQPAENS